MILERLALSNFRLHKNTELDFSENLNYIVGGNGQGKTTILEAMYFLCTTRSLNQASDNEALNFDERFFEITGAFRDTVKNKIRIYYDLDTNKKNVFLNDKQVNRASTLIGKFPVVTLTQSDHSITLGAPADRRKFVDSVISQSSETYLKILLEYNRTLRQRSSLLSQIKESNNRSLLSQLEAWTETLINSGSEIVKHRIKFIRTFQEYIENSYQRVMEGKEKPSVYYSFYGEQDESMIEEKFRDELKERYNDELRRATNLVGPHRDDFIFTINEHEIKKFGSQGQHKTFQIALRFGEFFYLKNIRSRVPIFLMDDVFGELDTNRSRKISEYLNDIGQAFITMTDFTNFEHLQKTENDLVLNVSNGKTAYA